MSVGNTRDEPAMAKDEGWVDDDNTVPPGQPLKL
jgi:hypothetical protein